jgi:hypothetical protein
MKLARRPGWNDFPENVFDLSAHRVLSHQPKEVFGMSLPMRNLKGKNVDRAVLEGITPGFRNTVQSFHAIFMRYQTGKVLFVPANRS